MKKNRERSHEDDEREDDVLVARAREQLKLMGLDPNHPVFKELAS